MNVNELKNIIYNEIGFERKSIEVLSQKNNRFGGLEEVIFKVKNEGYILKPNGDGIFFDFFDLNSLKLDAPADQEEPTEIPQTPYGENIPNEAEATENV